MTVYAFEERAPYEAGFSSVYDAEIGPYLSEMEGRRLAAVSRSKRNVAIAGVATLVLAVWAALAVHPVMALFPLIFGGALTLFLFLQRGQKLQSDIARHIRPILCRFLGDMQYFDDIPAGFADLDDLRALNVLPKTDHSSPGLAVSGTWRDVDFRLFKILCRDSHRDSDGDRRYTTVFSGIVLEVDCPVEMPRMAFVPDFGETMNKLYKWASGDQFPKHRWPMPIEEIDEIFEIYTDDIAATEQHLKPQFGRLLVDIAKRYQNDKPFCSAAFQGHKFYLALKLPHDFLNFDVIKGPLSDANEHIHQSLADLMIPREVIDTLLD